MIQKFRDVKKMWSDMSVLLPFLFTIVTLILAAGCAVYRMASERAYQEKWKDYHDCGI